MALACSLLLFAEPVGLLQLRHEPACAVRAARVSPASGSAFAHATTGLATSPQAMPNLGWWIGTLLSFIEAAVLNVGKGSI